MMSNKKTEAIASALFRELGNRKQFLVTDLSKIIEPVRTLLKETGDEQAARQLMEKQINAYHKK